MSREGQTYEVPLGSRSMFRGHSIRWVEDPAGGGMWVYEDTGEPTIEAYPSRPCGHCGEAATAEDHDACLGTLPGVANACCGHGNVDESYIQFTNGAVVRGFTLDPPRVDNGCAVSKLSGED